MCRPVIIFGQQLEYSIITIITFINKCFTDKLMF